MEHTTRSHWDLSGELFSVIDSLSELRGLATLDAQRAAEPALLGRALEILLRHQDLARCSIFLLDGDVLECAAGRGETDLGAAGAGGAEEPDERSTLRFRLGEGLVGMAAHSGILYHCPDCSADVHYRRAPGAPRPAGSLICAPMLSRDEVIGVVNAYHPAPNRFHSWHEAVLGLFACAVAHVLDNNRVLSRMPGMRAGVA